MHVIELLSSFVAFLAEHVGLVVESRGFQTIVGAQPICDNHGSGLDVVLDEQLSGFRVDRAYASKADASKFRGTGVAASIR